MTWLWMGLLIWLAVAVPFAVGLGKGIKLADERELSNADGLVGSAATPARLDSQVL